MIKLDRSHRPFWVLALLILAFTLLPTASAGAQTTTGERWYQVELIAFKRQLQDQQEQWPTTVKLGYPRTWVELKTQDQSTGQPDGEAVIAIESTASAAHANAFVLLSRNEQNLTRHAAALQRDSRFELLFHEAWRQPVVSTRNSPAILIRGGKNYGQHSELEGSITVSIAQLLQINTRLWLTEFARNQGQFSGDWPSLPVAPNLETQLSGEISDESEHPQLMQAQPAETDLLAGVGEPYVPARIVLMDEERKLRIKELHYFDHPLFGLIIQITPYDPSAPSPQL